MLRRSRRCWSPRDLRAPRVVLGLGFSLSGLAMIAGLGLRWPVLAGALLPPLIAGRFWWQRRRQITSQAIAAGPVLESWVLQARLASSLPPRPQDAELRQAICAEMEAIRQLAARCAELDGSSTVSLMVLVEGWLDRIQQVGGDLQLRGGRALVQQLALCRRQLTSLHDTAQQQAQSQPGQPVLLPPLPSPFQP